MTYWEVIDTEGRSNGLQMNGRTGRNIFEKMEVFGRILFNMPYRISRFLYILFVCVACLFFYTRAYASETNAAAQERTEVVALKNNLLYDAAATPNLQLEIKLAPKWTLELGAGFNPFPLNDKTFPKWRHVSASIAPRYWFCNAFYGGFISFNAAYAHYNVAGGAYPIGWIYNQVKDNRYQGDAVMGGVSGGWHFAISPHFSIELEGGIEAGYSWYDRFECKHCGVKTETGGRWLLLPKLGINLVVPLGGDKLSFEKRCDCEKLEQVEEVVEETTAMPNDTVAQPNDTTSAPKKVQETQSAPAAEEAAEPAQPAEPAKAVAASAQEPVQEPAQESVQEAASETPAEVQPQQAEPVVEKKPHSISELLRNDAEYEPYDPNMTLSADPRNVFVFFALNETKLDRSYFDNGETMDSVIKVIGDALADSTLRITRIRVVGLASFDGPQSYNEKLAGERAQTIKKYIQRKYNLPDSLFALYNGGESWSELRYHLDIVDMDGKEEVIGIIESEQNLSEREAQIKKNRTGGTYRYMQDSLKKILRNLGCITIYYENN